MFFVGGGRPTDRRPLKCTHITLSNNTNVAFITLLFYFLHSKYVNKRFIIKGLWVDVYLKGHGSYL